MVVLWCGGVVCGGVVSGGVTTESRDVETFTITAAAVLADPARLTAALSSLLPLSTPRKNALNWTNREPVN